MQGSCHRNAVRSLKPPGPMDNSAMACTAWCSGGYITHTLPQSCSESSSPPGGDAHLVVLWRVHTWVHTAWCQGGYIALPCTGPAYLPPHHHQVEMIVTWCCCGGCTHGCTLGGHGPHHQVEMSTCPGVRSKARSRPLAASTCSRDRDST